MWDILNGYRHPYKATSQGSSLPSLLIYTIDKLISYYTYKYIRIYTKRG